LFHEVTHTRRNGSVVWDSLVEFSVRTGDVDSLTRDKNHHRWCWDVSSGAVQYSTGTVDASYPFARNPLTHEDGGMSESDVGISSFTRVSTPARGPVLVLVLTPVSGRDMLDNIGSYSDSIALHLIVP